MFKKIFKRIKIFIILIIIFLFSYYSIIGLSNIIYNEISKINNMQLSNEENFFTEIFDKDIPKYTASKELTEKLISQTVSVLTINNGIGSCSGTVIHEEENNHYILTAKHCIGVDEEIYVEFEEVLYVILSPSDDLALLIVDGKVPNKVVAGLKVTDMEIGETVHHIAYPNRIVYKTSGVVSRYTKDWQYLDFEVIPGCSGGGVFDENGSLVSVIWGGYKNPEPDDPIKSVSEPLKDIKDFLSLIKIYYE